MVTDIENIPVLNNLSIMSDPGKYSRQEKIYQAVSEKEGRIYPDEVLRTLPNLPSTHPQAREWENRRHSLEVLQQYLLEKKQPLRILDLGTGNGWMSAALAQNSAFEITAIDLNLQQLEQADRVFGNAPNLHFVYGDINDEFLTPASFDIVILASSVQYFENLFRLVKRLLEVVKKGGEIHITGTLFYEPRNIAAAVEKSQLYFETLGTPEMHQYYHHHLSSALTAFKTTVMNGTTVLHKIRNKLSGRSAPYPWFRIDRP